MHESDNGGWTGTENAEAGAPAIELAEEHMAQSIARHGGLGLARLVVRGLNGNHPMPSTGPASGQKLQP